MNQIYADLESTFFDPRISARSVWSRVLCGLGESCV